MFHYVYRITCIPQKIHYYGVRSSKISPAQDIKKYRSSSSIVHMSIQTYGIENFKFKIVRTFTNRVDAMAFECFLHEKFYVDTNPQFMNLARNRTTRAYYSAPGELNPSWGKKMMYKDSDVLFVHTCDVKEFESRGYVVGRPEWLKQRRPGKQNHFYGKKHTDQAKEKISRYRSKPIRVYFFDGNVVEFNNRLHLGNFLGMSKSLGASLVTRKRTHLFKKYGIQKIEVENENILYQEG